MALANVEGPKYNEKVEYILEELGNGRSREDLAAEYDYSNYKSLDIYLRRRGFRYDSEKENYVPDLPEEEVVVPENANSKVTLIITMFTKEDADPKVIAESAGFEDHREMANYMQRQGYSWSTTQKNYRPAANKARRRRARWFWSRKFRSTAGKGREITIFIFTEVYSFTGETAAEGRRTICSC